MSEEVQEVKEEIDHHDENELKLEEALIGKDILSPIHYVDEG